MTRTAFAMMVAVGSMLGVSWTLQAAPIAPLPSVALDHSATQTHWRHVCTRNPRGVRSCRRIWVA